MIEIKFSKIPRWDEINKIIEQSKHAIVLLKFSKSVYEHPKMQYKLEVLKQEPNIFIEVENSKRGRKKKIDNFTKQKILELLKEGYSLREVGRELGISKSSVWNYAKDYITEIKKEKLKELIWELKETAVEESWYDYTVQALFLELEAYINNNDLEKSKEILQKIIEYRHEAIE
ncbi:helix-turn-helix domain-containing protein [Methanocaldococcus sp.]|uniref:helix-turn-helix domain-containing protein n=1 Tax=Methanocaldococcus sp. TaxID=2152917 RepID=UPI002639D764|nr:helix-turn-helix domain-containing protein [Methanocaldococcus sp.]MCQ6254550.1 helix-turn-helix domain-containing protein [Methanocaldococcus sp.]